MYATSNVLTCGAQLLMVWDIWNVPGAIIYDKREHIKDIGQMRLI